jgi:hypothetical protein
LGTVHDLSLFRRSRLLSPDQAKLASRAFGAALEALRDHADGISAHRIRHLVATYVVERVMTGEVDPLRIASGAMQALTVVATTCDNE